MTRHALYTLLPLSLLAACATAPSRVEGQWIDPAFAGRSLRNVKVLVSCRAPDYALARVCEDHLARNLIDVGAIPVMADAPINPTEAPSAVGHAAQRAGAQAAILSTVAVTANDLYAPRSAVGIGFGVGRGVGIGVSGGFAIPLGGVQATPALAAHTSLLDAASGSEIWAMRASRAGGEDLSAQTAALAAGAIESMRRAGLFDAQAPQ
jgi:hypothetical protein